MDEVLWIEPRDISDTPGDAEIMAVQMASYVLYKLTGQKFPGFKNTTEWYCSSYVRVWSSALYADLQSEREC